MAGAAYAAGELAARHSQIDLYEDGKGIYVPGQGYIQVDPETGKLIPPEGMDDTSSLEWVMSNFHMTENGIEPISDLEVVNLRETELDI